MTAIADTTRGPCGMLAVVTQDGVPLTLNGDFETDISGWFGVSATVTQDGIWAHTGSYSLSVTATGATFDTHASMSLSGPTAGRTFSVVGWVHVPVGSHLIGLTLQCIIRESGGAMGTADHITSYTLVAGDQMLTAQTAITQNDRTAILTVWKQAGSAHVGDQFNLDSVVVRETTTSGANADWNLPTVKVEVDWTADNTWIDESANCRSVTWQRGRARVNDVFAAGTATVTLRNLDGRYSPFYTSSPLYPDVVASREIRLTASYRGVSYPLYHGYIAEVIQTVSFSQAATVLQCLDAFNGFALSNKAAAKQTAQTVDQIISAILTAQGWTGSTSLDAGATIPTYVQPTGTTLQGLQDAALQDVTGHVYMTAQGAVRFENHESRARKPVTYVFTAVEANQIDVRQTDLVSEVDITYNTQAGHALAASATTTLSATYDPTQAVPALSSISLTANSAIDGTGLDVSLNIWVTAITVAGTVASVSIYNSLPYTVYVQSLSAVGLSGISGPQFTAIAAGSFVQTQTLSMTFTSVAEADIIGAWAQYAASVLRNPHPRPVVNVVGKTPSLIEIMLSLDLSSRIVLQDTAGPFLSGITEQFFVENIQGTISMNPPQVPTLTLQLFDKYQGTL